jgi:hypothetical protein
MEKTPLSRLMKLSEHAYDVYLKNGKTYFHALTLYEINRFILETLFKWAEQGYELSDYEERLFIHLIQWKNTFEYYEASRNPNYEDPFIFERFEGSYPYPARKN